MLTIYCDASYDEHLMLGAWGCVIQYRNRTYTYSGHRSMPLATYNGELWAILKALGVAKAFCQKKIVIYTDCASIIPDCEAMRDNKQRKKVLKRKSDKDERQMLYSSLVDYFEHYNIRVEKIPREENLAHDLAHKALREGRESLRQNNIAMLLAQDSGE